MKPDYEKGFQVGLQTAIEAMTESDPLLAICEWEDADDIAHAVKRYLIQRVQEQLPPTGATHDR